MQGNTKVLKLSKGLLSYNRQLTTDNRQPVQYNTITTPRGGKYEVVLPDGSKVWLNTASSIKFPTAFTGERREVTITGEAYFEIAKNTEKPFIVQQADIAIKVLGTSFNVMAYDDETGMKVTLVEGAVRVAPLSGYGKEQGVKLSPGQQVILNLSNDGKHEFSLVKDVNVSETIAWKDNLFWFDNDNVQEVIKKLSRWYNIEITVDGNIPDRFTGSIPMDLPFSRVVGMLQKTGRIQYKITDEKKIVVSP
jgi:ferric-dicitrate binding protein FerR (iron transport regulator)